MIQYKATLGTLSYIFNTETECDTFIAFNSEYVKGTQEVDINQHLADTFQRAKSFGETLMNTFLLDNWQSAVSFTPEMSGTLLTKFTTVKQLADLGDIKTIAAILPSIEIDAIYTQERKDKYLAMVNQFVEIYYPKPQTVQ